MRRELRRDPSTYDLKKLRTQCGWKIRPAEIIPLDSWHIVCLKCQAAIPYGVKGRSKS
jgi:hypothetical protein